MDAKRRKRVDANWALRRRQAKLQAEFEYLRRECVQLCEKRFVKPPIESIELTEVEKKFLKDLRDRKLKEVVTKQCLSTIKFLMGHKTLAFPFNEPVNTVMYRDYLNYVRTPMDFGTVKGKIHQYKTPFEFEADVRLVFENARKYNAPDTEVREMARLLESKFEEKWTKSVLPRIEELKAGEIEDQTAFKQSKADNVVVEAETRVDECCRLLLNKLEALMIEIDFLKCLAAFECEVMTPHDRLVLGYELSMLPKRYFQRAVNLVLMQNPGLLATMSNNVIEFDINKMDPLTLAQLQDLVQNLKKRVAKSKPQNKHGEPSERKRRKRSASPLQNRIYPSVDGPKPKRQHMHWPEMAFGLGLKRYDQEVEGFVPRGEEGATIIPLPHFVSNFSSGESEDPGTPLNVSPVHFKKEETPLTNFSSLRSFSSILSSPSFSQNPISIPTFNENDSEKRVSFSALDAWTLGNESSLSPAKHKLYSSHESSISFDSMCGVSELRPPTVMVHSVGLSAIPLVPVSQPNAGFPSFFTANLNTSLSSQGACFLQPVNLPITGPLTVPYICSPTTRPPSGSSDPSPSSNNPSTEKS